MRLVKRHESLSEMPPLMSGRLDDVSLPELVQLFATGGRSVRIEVSTDDGRKGRVTVEHGQLAECRFGELLGEEAFFALFQEGGRFFVYRIDPDRSRRAAVSRGWQELILEAARREDEAQRPTPSGERPSGARSSAEAQHGSYTQDDDLGSEVREKVEPEFNFGFDESPAAMPVIPSPSRVPSESMEDTPSTEPTPTGYDEPPEGAGAEAREESERTAGLEPEPERPDEFEVIFAEAMRAYMRRSLDEAQSLFEKCLELRPNDSRVRANLQRLADMRNKR